MHFPQAGHDGLSFDIDDSGSARNRHGTPRARGGDAPIAHDDNGIAYRCCSNAIDESRAALVQEPASTLAQESLLDALETKVALLQDTVALASDTAGGTDETAAAAKERNQ